MRQVVTAEEFHVSYKRLANEFPIFIVRHLGEFTKQFARVSPFEFPGIANKQSVFAAVEPLVISEKVRRQAAKCADFQYRRVSLEMLDRMIETAKVFAI